MCSCSLAATLFPVSAKFLFHFTRNWIRRKAKKSRYLKMNFSLELELDNFVRRSTTRLQGGVRGEAKNLELNNRKGSVKAN